MNSYTYIRSNYFHPLDEIMNWDGIEEIVLTSLQQPSQTEVIDDKLAIWKPQVISALINNVYRYSL